LGVPKYGNILYIRNVLNYFQIMAFLKVTFDPKAIIREINRNPQGITQQKLFVKTIAGYKGSKQSSSYTESMREIEKDGYIWADRTEPTPLRHGLSDKERSRVKKWYPTGKPYGLRMKVASMLNS